MSLDEDPLDMFSFVFVKSAKRSSAGRPQSPSREAQLSKLGAIFNKANSPPRIIARRGGRAIKKILRSIRFLRGQGGVPIERTRNTTPAAAIMRLRTIFLVTPPPLLAVMRGGEFAFFKMTPLNHICFFGRSGRASERFPQSNLDSFSSDSHLPS